MCFIITCTTSVVNLCVLTYQNPVKRRWFIFSLWETFAKLNIASTVWNINPARYFSIPYPVWLFSFRADADRAAPYPDPNGHVGGVQERHAGGAAAGLGLCGPDFPLFGSPAGLPQEPLQSSAGTQTGWNPNRELPKLHHPQDWRYTASAG